MLKKVAAFAVFFISVAQVTTAQDVQVLLRPKMDPMPPQVMNYIGNPGTYFDVSLTNTTDEVQNVFLTLEVSKQTGGELSVTTPYYIQPNKAITLVPKRLTTVDQVTLLGQFRQLLPKDITLKGADVSDFYDNGVVGLLPEGTYQAQVKVYKWDPAIKYPQLVSDPLQGKCTFSVCYNASAPEILVPLYNPLELRANALGISKRGVPGMASDENDAKWQPAILDPVKAQFVWKTPVINCGGKVRSYKYQLDIFPIGTTQTSAEEAVATGTIAKTVKNLVAAQCILSEAEVAQMTKFSPTGYFVARVTATPTVTDKNNVDYSTIENNGHSQLLVFRLKQTDSGKGGKLEEITQREETKLEESKTEEKKEEVVEVDPGYKEPEKNDNKKFVYTVPKLTAPTPFKGNVLKEKEDLNFKWEKPMMVSGNQDTLRFSYNVSVFKKKASQSIDSLLVSKPLFTEKSLSSQNYTLRWDSIAKKVSLNDNLVVAVLPVCLNESSVGYDKNGEDNIYRGSYVTGETGKLIDCDPEAGKSITNRELAKFSEKELRDMEVMVGQFPLTIENANLVDGDHYEGRGYITWKPMGDLPFQINVTFSKLYINSDKIVYDGEVLSAKEEEKEISDYIPYEMFDDLFLADLIGAGTAEAYGDKLFQYIEDDQSMAKYCEYAREYAPILDDIINQKVSVNLPVSLTKLIPTCPVDIQIMSGRWSPTNASVSIIGMFAMPESKYTDSQVAVFGLPRLCIQPESFVPEGCTIALLSDFYIKDPSTQFVFTLKAPSDLQKMEDGCSISFTNKGFQEMHFEADMEIPGLIKADKNGERVRGERPHIDIKADIEDWDKWIGEVKMDNFEVEEAPGFTFVPSGEGIVYDHHPEKNSTAFSFPTPLTPKGGIDKDYKPLTYDKTKLDINSDKENGKWQGLYIDKIGCWLPPIFKQGDGNNRIEVAMKQFLWDDSGVSFTISAAGTNGGDLVGIETGKLGGWGISLHEVGVSVVQGDFGCTYFTGMLRAPLIGGKWNYSTSFDKIDKGAGGNDLRILFHMEPQDNPKFDFFLAELDLDKDYTHLDVQYTNSDKKTKVELELAGHVTVAGTEEITKKLDFNISGLAFTGMRVANFAKPEGSNNRSDVQAMKYSHTFEPICEGPNCWFDLGTWGLASAEKTLGPFKFSLDNFGVSTSGENVGINIVGTIGLVSNVFSATAGVTIWAKVDLDKLDIAYKETTLDELGISSEFGGCKVAGSLKFVDEDEKKGTKVKGYAGTLEIKLPGDLFQMKAAGGFFNAEDTQHGKFTSAYFLAEVGGAQGIPIGPVQLNNIMGGFFFHTSLDMSSVEANETDPFKWKTSIKYGTHGGMFGLGISTVGSDRGLNAKVKMTVLYDAERNRLSTFRMTGEMHALCTPGADDGMINGNCCIVYQNMPQNEGGKYFQINITMDAGGDMQELYKRFTGEELPMPECLGDLQELGDQGNQKSKDAKDSKPKISCGVNISLDFKVTMKPDDCTDPKFKSKWHLYVGQPGDGSASSLAKDRCSITFIDFQVGSKKGKVAAWCKEWANAYLCIGNELPNNGQLPPIPAEIDEFLYGSSNKNIGSASDKQNHANAQKARESAVGQFDGSAKSGVMFGAQVGGNWGVRAVICYAEATLLAGFDVVLKQLENAQCNGKPAGGKGGFYGMGQVYAMAKGEMGLIIDLWIYKGDWSLIDVGVGAVLKGGFPNPSWLYGKVKATCKLFGGLIKFSGSLTFELGDICFPDAGNPLDDIKIFEDMTPGEAHTGSANSTPSGFERDEVSVFAPAGFTTNMKIGARLDLVDENTANRMAGRDGDPAAYAQNAARSYKFYLEPQGVFESWTDKNAWKNGSSGTGYQMDTYNYRTSDQETYEYVVTGGKFRENRYYKVTQRGYCKEIRQGHEVDPYYKQGDETEESPHPWTDKIIYYFHTGALPNNLMEGDQIAFTLPQVTDGNRFYKNEMESPEVHLKVDRASDDIFNTSKYDLVARFEKNVNGNWIPVDAVVRVDTYKSGKDYYYVDENGNVDYTIKVNSLGEVVETQVDPFAQTDNQGDYYTYKGKTYRYYGVNRERIQRFAASLGSTMASAVEIVGADKASYYYPLKWIPTGFNSIEKAIEYYQAMINSESTYLKNKLSSVSSALTSLKDELINAMEGTTHPYVKDVDIRYVYQDPYYMYSNPSKYQYMIKQYETALETINETKQKMERCLNDGVVYHITTTYLMSGPKTDTITYANRHQIPLDIYKRYIDNYNTEISTARRALENGFNSYTRSSELNNLKTLYLELDIPYSKIKADYENAVKVEPILTQAKAERETQKTTMANIRDAKYTIPQKQGYLSNLNTAKTNKFEKWRKDAGNLYPEYWMSKEVSQIADAFTDSVAELTKYVKFLQNSETVKNKANELEALLESVNDYMDKTSEASRNYSYVKGKFYNPAIRAFETAKDATNHGSEFERAKTAFNAIESAIFGSEKLVLEFANEQKTASNTALRDAESAASAAIAANDATVAERKKTSSSNDNASKVNELKDAEEKAYAKAYDLANEVGNISASVKKNTARHTGELNKTAGADRMRQIVADCDSNAQKAMRAYKKAVAYANSDQLLVYSNKVDKEFAAMKNRLDLMIRDIERTLSQLDKMNRRDMEKVMTTMISHEYNMKKSLETIKESVETSKGINDEHSTYYVMVETLNAAEKYSEAATYLKQGVNSDTKYFASASNTLSSYTTNMRNTLSRTAVSKKEKSTESFRRSSMGAANTLVSSINKLTSAVESRLNTMNTSKTSKPGTIALDSRYSRSSTSAKMESSTSLTNMLKNSTTANTNTTTAKLNTTTINSKTTTVKTNSTTTTKTVNYNNTTNTKTTKVTSRAKRPGTVPGVAEAFELMASDAPETPETPETPDGPAGAAVVSKVAGMMNASLPKPKPKPEVPAESVISSASAMLNGKSSSNNAENALPDIPTVNGVVGVPATDPYSTANSYLRNAYSASGKTTTVYSNTSGATMHVDATSLAKSKLSTIPVYFNKNSNNAYQYLSFSNLDMYKSVVSANPTGYKNYEYRVVVMQVDKVKFQNAQLQSKKETETTTKEAQLDASNQSYLSGTGKDGTEGNGDSYNLQAYMANYYKEMEKQGLQKNEGVDSITKLQKQKISYTNFASEIYEWNLDFYGCTIEDDFATWANKYMNANATSTQPNKQYLDWTLEGVRPLEIAYYNNNYSPTELAKNDDSVLLTDMGYYLYDPYVWLAYVGSYALFNSKKISSKSSYWDQEFGSPQSVTIEFNERSSPYRWKTVPSIDYTNRTSNYSKAAYLIRQIGVGYYSCSYNDCLTNKISSTRYKQDVFTAIDDIEEMLWDIHEMAYDLNFYYTKLWNKKTSTIQSEFKKWNEDKSRCGNLRIKAPRIQVGFVYQSQWLTYNKKSDNDYKGYFPGYPYRNNPSADGTALSHQNYGGRDYRFRYDWYCDNIKHVKHEFYRCNIYNVNGQYFTMWSNESIKKKYTTVKTWKDPLKGYGVGGFGFTKLDPEWK